jgi:hypothetical protein
MLKKSKKREMKYLNEVFIADCAGNVEHDHA